MDTRSAVSRRDFIRTSSVIVVSFALGRILPAHAAGQDLPGTSDLGKSLDPREVDSFLALHADGSVTIYTSKVDVGTGLRIAMSQMVAEELGVPINRVTIVEGDTALTPNQGGTGGSTGIPRGAVEVRQAAATARAAISAPGSAFVPGKPLLLKVDPKAPLKDPTQYTIVGRPLPRPDIPAKCTGRHEYVQDVTVRGMLHARVIHPPAIGATLVSVDESSLRGIPDVRVVRLNDFLAVAAEDEWAAVSASRALKVTWSESQTLPGSDGLDRHVRQSAVDRDEVVVNRGDARAALASAAKQLSATYFWPFQSHASLGPSCAVADVRDDGK